MALYAFDGTWNVDKPGADRDTNVIWFHEAYQDVRVYKPGVGTRFGLFGGIVGGLTGAGGRSRVDEMFQQLVENLDAGKTDIDIIGFSRGAALAVHFANMVANITPTPPPIRFLGVWDCVPSFGLASVDLNIGWDLDLPDNVQKCYHVLALDERRHTFHLQRLSANVDHADQPGRLFEVWFRGIHSDVGGGNNNRGLSTIPLNWMLAKAVSCGLPIDPALVTRIGPQMKPDCKISDAPWYDVIRNRRRTIRWNDQVHSSVAFSADCNNPPEGLSVVDDAGNEVRRFKRRP